MAAEIASSANVKKILFFHHDPFRSDDEIAHNRNLIAGEFKPVIFEIAAEGKKYYC